jgi:hypothetical protein
VDADKELVDVDVDKDPADKTRTLKMRMWIRTLQKRQGPCGCRCG